MLHDCKDQKTNLQTESTEQKTDNAVPNTATRGIWLKLVNVDETLQRLQRKQRAKRRPRAKHRRDPYSKPDNRRRVVLPASYLQGFNPQPVRLRVGGMRVDVYSNPKTGQQVFNAGDLLRVADIQSGVSAYFAQYRYSLFQCKFPTLSILLCSTFEKAKIQVFRKDADGVVKGRELTTLTM
jgi:hypothetical protein